MRYVQPRLLESKTSMRLSIHHRKWNFLNLFASHFKPLCHTPDDCDKTNKLMQQHLRVKLYKIVVSSTDSLNLQPLPKEKITTDCQPNSPPVLCQERIFWQLCFHFGFVCSFSFWHSQYEQVPFRGDSIWLWLHLGIGLVSRCFWCPSQKLKVRWKV